MSECNDVSFCESCESEEMSVCRMPSLVPRTHSLFRQLSAGIENPDLSLYEKCLDEKLTNHFVVSVEDVRGTDSGTVQTSICKPPLTNSPSKNLVLDSQLQGLKNTIERMASHPGNRQSIKGNNLTERVTTDYDKPWQSIEQFLRERNKDTEPETLTKHRKPFYKRTWFACTTYGLTLLALIAAILALASERAIIMPRMVLDGEIFPTPESPVVRPSQDSSPQASPLQSLLSDQTTPSSTTPPANTLRASLPMLTEPITTTAPPADVQSTTPLPGVTLTTPSLPTSADFPEVSTQAQPQGVSLTFVLSLPGPLQRFSRSRGVH